MKQFHGHVIVAGAVLALAVALQLTAVPVEWEFPRLGSCHEGMAFSDGVTGVLAIARNYERDCGRLVDGIPEDECFEVIPYAD